MPPPTRVSPGTSNLFQNVLKTLQQSAPTTAKNDKKGVEAKEGAADGVQASESEETSGQEGIASGAGATGAARSQGAGAFTPVESAVDKAKGRSGAAMAAMVDGTDSVASAAQVARENDINELLGIDNSIEFQVKDPLAEKPSLTDVVAPEYVGQVASGRTEGQSFTQGTTSNKRVVER